MKGRVIATASAVSDVWRNECGELGEEGRWLVAAQEGQWILAQQLIGLRWDLRVLIFP